MKPLQLALAILCISSKKSPISITKSSDTGVALYYYMVKTQDGRVRRMSSLASSLKQAENFARLEVEAYNGKIISKLKMEKRYEWQRVA